MFFKVEMNLNIVKTMPNKIEWFRCFFSFLFDFFVSFLLSCVRIVLWWWIHATVDVVFSPFRFDSSTVNCCLHLVDPIVCNVCINYEQMLSIGTCSSMTLMQYQQTVRVRISMVYFSQFFGLYTMAMFFFHSLSITR